LNAAAGKIDDQAGKLNDQAGEIDSHAGWPRGRRAHHAPTGAGVV
jgi:hypothetical protein